MTEPLPDYEALRLLFPTVGVVERWETWSFNTHDWPRVPLLLVSAACGRPTPVSLSPTEVQELVDFMGRLQERLDNRETRAIEE